MMNKQLETDLSLIQLALPCDFIDQTNHASLGLNSVNLRKEQTKLKRSILVFEVLGKIASAKLDKLN